MKISLTLLFICVAITFAEDLTLDEGVIVLNDDNFSSTINQFKYAMVLFYTPEQLSSKNFGSEYSAAAKRVSEELPGIKLCKIDSSQNEDYAKTFGSSNGELVIKFFKIGDIEPISYDGEFRADDIGEWLLNKIDDLIPGVSSLEEAQHFISEHKNVGFYFESKDIGKFHEFLGFTTNISDVDFIKTDSEDLMKKFEAWDDSFILFRDHGEEHNAFKGEPTFENLNKFIKVYKEPALMQLTPAAANKINSELMDFVLLIHDNSEEGLEKQKSFNEVAKKHRGKIFFFVGQPGEEHVDKFMTKFDFTTANLPVVGILHTSDEHKKYRFDRQITEKNLNIFLANFFEGNLAHYQRSSRQPGREYDGSVMVSVEGDYNSIVLDNTKDVMIEWYSPWCGHCIHFAPTYAELAEKLKNVPDLIIAKIDATANHVEGVSIYGYPTVKFYPRNKKENPVDYTGDRTVEKIIDFIKEQGTVQINL